MNTVDETPTDQAVTDARTRPVRGNPWLTLIAVALGVMMVALDGTVVAVANPEIQKDLGSSLSDLQWVTNAYLLALAIFLITAGKLGDRFGHKAMFFTGMIGFALTSLLIGLAPRIDAGHALALMIVFRVLQGVFGAILQPSALGLLRSTFPPEKLNMAIGIWGGVIGASAAAGPIVGGLLVQHVSWESVFYVNVPVAAVALLVGTLVLAANRRVDPTSRFDAAGVTALSAAMFCLVFGLVKASEWGWSGGRTWLFLTAAVLLGALLVLVEKRVADPLLPMGLFRSRNLALGTVMMVLVAFTLMGGMFFFTFYFQNAHGYSPVQTGVHLLPMTAMMIVGSPLAGSLMNRFGPRVILCVGMTLMVTSTFGLSTLRLDTSTPLLSLWLVLLGLGLSHVLLGATDTIVAGAPVRLAGTASGLQQAAMQVGGSLGTAVLTAVMSTRVGDVLPGHLADHGLHVTDAQLDGMRSAVASGVAPVSPQTPDRLVRSLTTAAHDTFIDGLHTAFLVAGALSTIGLLLALGVRRYHANTDQPTETAAQDATQTEDTHVQDASAGRRDPADAPGAAPTGPLLYGQVRGGDDTPVAAATLTLIDLNGRQVGHARLGERGNYQLPVRSAGTYLLITSARAHQPHATTVLVGAQPQQVDVSLAETGGLYGTVRDSTRDAAVPDAVVVLTDARGTVVDTRTTGDDGGYQFHGLSAGEYTLAISHPMHGTAATRVTVDHDERSRCDLTLRESIQLVGTVRLAADGGPVADARVALLDSAGQETVAAVTGADGTYRFSNLPPGRYTLIASGYAPTATTLSLARGARWTQDLALGHSGEASGPSAPRDFPAAE